MNKWKYLYPYEPGTSTVDGFPGHGIIADKCHFRLHHHVLSKSGKRYMVSSIGYMPNPLVHKDHEGGQWHNFGGWMDDDDVYKVETMVFVEKPMADGHMEMVHPEIDWSRSIDSIEGTEIHMNLVEKYEEM